jgi:hypothetical protein
LAVLIIAISATVAVIIGPHCAGDAANCGTDRGPFKDPEARDQRAGSRTKGCTAANSGRNTAKRRIITLRLTGIILAILVIAVGIAIIIIISPYSAGETTDASTNRRAFDEADTRDKRASRNARSAAECCTLGNVASRTTVGSSASAKRYRPGHHSRQNHFSHHNLQPVG